MIKLRNATNGTVSLTTASQQILAVNEFRKRAIIVNGSDVGVWLSFNATAVIGTGIYLAPNGGSFEIDPEEIYTAAIHGIAASGAGKIVGTVEFY